MSTFSAEDFEDEALCVYICMDKCVADDLAPMLRQAASQARELEGLRADAARLDWLDETGKQHGHAFCHVYHEEFRYYVLANFNNVIYPTAREIIDAAIKKKEA